MKNKKYMLKVFALLDFYWHVAILMTRTPKTLFNL